MKKRLKKKKKNSPKKISAKEFDNKFDNNENIDEFIEWNKSEKLVNVSFPLWMVKELDKEANRLGINRQALIKVWIANQIEQSKKKKAG